jgi:hypothetical protein
MADQEWDEDESFTSGATLFVFLEDAVLVLGENGTQALIPAEDLEAFFLKLVERLLPPESPDEEEWDR